MPRQILILFAHPAYHKSRANRYLNASVQSMPGVYFHDLYEAYPYFHIDVRREQQLLLEHDVIIFQSPFYWYSTPAVLKEWQDLVLEHGFAYGEKGTSLQGKLFLNALTVGGPESAYERAGSNFFSIRELLTPLEQTARFCGMHYLPPLVVFETLRDEIDEPFRLAASAYRRLLEGLRDDTVDLREMEKFKIIHAAAGLPFDLRLPVA